MNSRMLVLGGFALALAGCSTTQKTGLLEATTFGEAKAATMAAQVVDPAPQYEYLDPATSGDKAAQAIQRYRSDKVKQPERVRSTQTGSGSGGGGSGN